jgi:hypothetical protein
MLKCRKKNYIFNYLVNPYKNNNRTGDFQVKRGKWNINYYIHLKSQENKEKGKIYYV